MGDFHNVRHNERCPICDHPGWCSINDDHSVVLCRRIAEGGKEYTDAAGVPYYLHRLTSATETAKHPKQAAKGKAQRANPDTLHRAYNALLGDLTLSSGHRANLLQRGLSEAQVAAGEYRTMPERRRGELASRLAERFGDQVLSTVPGFHVATADDRSWWSLGGAAGLLIPCRDYEGRVVALKVRVDNSTDANRGPRYTYVSSSKHGGPGPGAVVHVPREPRGERMVRVTEGELKADVATALSGVLTIALPGVASWRAALPVLAQVGSPRVLLAFDADLVDNPDVWRAAAGLLDELGRNGYQVAVERWSGADGKGIDDLLAAGHFPVRRRHLPAAPDQRPLPPTAISHLQRQAIGLLAKTKDTRPGAIAAKIVSRFPSLPTEDAFRVLKGWAREERPDLSLTDLQRSLTTALKNHQRTARGAHHA